MIDIHTHALPFMDDGAKSVDETIEILAELESQGVRSVIFTPHFYSYNESVASFAARIESAKEQIKNKLSGFNINFYYGAEVFLSKYFFKQKNLEKLKISGTDYMLIELPYTADTDTAELAVFFSEIVKINIKPIIAHIERYPYIFQNNFIDFLKKIGCLFQMNAEYLLSPIKRLYAKKLLHGDFVDFISSDVHNMSTRKPHLAKGIEILKSKFNIKYYDKICENEKALLLELEKTSISD